MTSTGTQLESEEIDLGEGLASIQIDVAREAVRDRLFGTRELNRTISRFTLLERVGSGAMGTVYAAYDPQLDRRVAVKILDRGRTSSKTRDAERLLAEARAMAKLTHPNVVTVYEVGVHDDGDAPVVFVAMQFLQGMTLRRWVEQRRPRWDRIVATFVGAGRGLAAVHSAGLVHRDFKPDNVMVTDHDERAVVMDFGLAQVDPTASTPGHDDESPPTLRSGRVSGTPAYMAPELFSGLPATDRSDQFAFCVALFEALFGCRPFDGRTPAELLASMSIGVPKTPADARGVPRAVRRLVQRGLDPDPRHRHTSLHVLLGQLERTVGRRRRMASFAIAAGLVAVAPIAAVMGRQGDSCAPEAALERTWDDGRRAELQAALLRAAPPGAEDIGPRVSARIDTWAQRWSESFAQVCAARPQWSSTLADRAGSCLDRRLDHLDAAVSAISRVDTERRSRAIELIESLPAPEPCADRPHLLAELEPPADAAIAAEVEDIRRALAHSRARRGAAEISGLVDAIELELARARATAYDPVVAEALLEKGDCLGDEGRQAPSASALQDAFFVATACGHVEVAIAAATELILAAPRDEGHEDGLLWERHARALLASRPDDPLRTADLDTMLGNLERERNELDHAKALHESALRVYEEHNVEHAAGEAATALGFLALRTGDLDTAAQRLEEAREIALRTLGMQNPALGDALVGLATVAQRRGARAEAAELAREAADVYIAAFGPDHPHVAGALHNLASIEVSAGDYTSARRDLEPVLALRERLLGANHAEVGRTLGLLAVVYEELEQYELARAANERALKIMLASYGPDDPRVADIHQNLGSLAHAQGDHARAVAELENVVEIRRKTQGEHHADLGLAHHNLADAYLGTGDLDAAQRHGELALEIAIAALGGDHERVSDERELLQKIARARAAAR